MRSLQCRHFLFIKNEIQSIVKQKIVDINHARWSPEKQTVDIHYYSQYFLHFTEFFLDAIASLEVGYVRVSVGCHQFCNHLSKTDKFWRFKTDEQPMTNRRWPTEDDQQKMTNRGWPTEDDQPKMTSKRQPKKDDN